MTELVATLEEAKQRITELEAELQAARVTQRDIQQLSSLRERLELALKSGKLGVWEWNVVSGELHWDQTMCEIYGVSKTENPVPYEFWRGRLHEQDVGRIERELEVAVGNQQPFHSQFRIYADSEHTTVRHIRVNALCHYDASGKPTRMIGINWDVSESVQAEQRNADLKNQLQQAQKLEAIGTLAGGIAHDFNNMLGAIIGYTELMKRSVEEKLPDMAQMMDKVLAASFRARELVSQILVFSRQESVEDKPIELEPVVREAIDFLKASLPSTIRIQAQLEDVGCIVGNPTQINQIIINLATNASQALPDQKGEVAISLAAREITDEEGEGLGLLGGRYAVMAVRDNGVGMPPEIQARVFEPFFTTKQVGEGTGLGLSAVHGIVLRHEGAIHLESEPGQGTCFTIYWPLTGSADAELDAPGVVSLSQGGGEHIVLIDDETSLLSMNQIFLEESGYRVTAFNESPQARQFIRSHLDDVEFIITDQVMPELTGSEIIEELRGMGVMVPAIITTGFGYQLDASKVSRLGKVRILRKPCSLNELFQAIEIGLKS